MKIYVAHASGFDFVSELYAPLRASSLWSQHQFVLPHENPAAPVRDSKEVIASCDLVLAEVSHPSIGMGIELGWADAAGVPIVAIHRADVHLSGAVKIVARSITSYTNLADDIIHIIK